MKLGICYMVFDGVELLEFALKSIRNHIDFIAVTYQTTSYFGNPANSELIPTLEKLKSENLIDQLIFFEPDLTIHHKFNELNLRNLGLQASRKMGCTHHISADVDELYDPDQLEYVKKIMDEENYDFSIVHQSIYYKDPTFLVHPDQKLCETLIHPVENEYFISSNKFFPFPIEITRRLKKYDKYRVFTKDEFTIHHMSYVRKNIHDKFANSDNTQFYQIKKFIDNYNTYQLGGRVCLIPDFMNRKTIKVENKFNIKI